MLSNRKLQRYFKVQRDLGKTFQHPGGRNATERLLGYVAARRKPENVLELGCGAGATAALLLDSFGCLYTGVDGSRPMLERALAITERFEEKRQLVEADLRSAALPFRASAFDVIIAESVLAILDPENLLPDCARVLRPGGVLAWNDRIWSREISTEARDRLNEVSRAIVGFSAAAMKPATVDDWRRLAEGSGFSVEVFERVQKGHGPGDRKEKLRSRLDLFVHLLIHPPAIPVWARERSMSRTFAGLWGMMEEWLFVCRKP